MNTKKVARRTRARTMDRLRRAGLPPLDALAVVLASGDDDAYRDVLAHSAMRELLRGSAVGQVIEDGAVVGSIASTSYQIANAMIEARTASRGSK